MIGIVGRLWPALAIGADARLLRLRAGADAASVARARIEAATRDGRLDAIRHWTGVWAELMRVCAPAGREVPRGPILPITAR